MRLSARYGLPVRPLLNEVLGIRVEAWTVENFHRVLEPAHDAIRRAMALPGSGPLFQPGRTAQATARALDTYLQAYRPRQLQTRNGSRFCPACLSERDGAWRHEWQQPLATVCCEHRVVLLTGCPQCSGTQWSGSAWLAGSDQAWICAHAPKRHPPPDQRHVAKRCGFDLRQAMAPTATDVDVGIQALLTRLGVLARHPTQIVTFFDREFTCVDVFCAIMEMVEEAPKGSPPHWMPSDPAALLTALRPAVAVIESPDTPTAITKAAELLGHNGPYSSALALQNIRRRKRNPVLGYLLLSGMAPTMTPTGQLTFRTASSMPRYPDNSARWPTPSMPGRPGQTQLSWIPQTMWSDALPAALTGNGYLERAVSSMFFARLGSTRSWQHIAIDLGLPAAFRTRPPAFVRKLQKNRAWPTYLATLEELFDRISNSPPPINYQQRRRVCADTTLVLRAAEHTLRHLDNPSDQVSTLLCAQTFWQIYTNGDIRLAAPPLGVPMGPSTPIKNRTNNDDPHVRELLETIRTVVERAAMVDDDGPLWWEPP